MGKFYWGVLRFFRGFLFSSAAASSSLILSLLRFANSFASSRYFFCWSVFCLECCLFLRLDWVLLSLFYYGDLCAFRSTSCCLLNGFDLLSASHIPYSQFFLQRTSFSVSTISSTSTPRSAPKTPEEGSSAVEFPHHNPNVFPPRPRLHPTTYPPTNTVNQIMKPSTVFVCLMPAVALAQQQPPSAVQPSPSVPNTTPPAPLPELQQQQQQQQQLDGQTNQIPDYNGAAAEPTDTTRPVLGTTKSLQARSEGTLGQSPWIGMAIGLTCTALAAVTLG